MAQEFGGYNGLFDALDAETSHSTNRRNKLSFIDSKDKLVKIQTGSDSLSETPISSFIRLALLKPVTSYMPTPDDTQIYSGIRSPGVIRMALQKLSGLLAIDLETNGLQAADPSTHIVGLGIASNEKLYYFDFKRNSEQCNQLVLDFLAEYQEGLAAFNLMFDGTFLLKATGKWLDWRYDAYAMLRQLANERYNGFYYSLKFAQTALLNWPVRGDEELDQWLVDNGYYNDKDTKKQPTKHYYRGPNNEKGETRYYKPLKGEMHNAPADILGFYCCLDTASTYQLLIDVLLESVQNEPWFPVFDEYHKVFIQNVRRLAEQQLAGITIQKPELAEYSQILNLSISGRTVGWLTNSA